jgi:hypothetical protein
LDKKWQIPGCLLDELTDSVVFPAKRMFIKPHCEVVRRIAVG